MQVIPDLIVGSAIGLIGAALYGLSVVVYRSQADAAGPIEVSAIKMWVALPFMVIMTLLLPGIAAAFLPLATIWLLSLSVLFGAVIGDTVYLWSQARIGVSYAFPIAMSFPILTFFMTVGFLGEAFILSRLAGAIIAVIGIILISNEQNKSQQDNETPGKLDLLGILGAILTALLYAVGTTVLQVGIEGVDPIAGNLIRVVVGSFAFLPVVAAAAMGRMRIPSKRATTYVIIAAFFGMDRSHNHVCHLFNRTSLCRTCVCLLPQGEVDKGCWRRNSRDHSWCCSSCSRVVKPTELASTQHTPQRHHRHAGTSLGVSFQLSFA